MTSWYWTTETNAKGTFWRTHGHHTYQCTRFYFLDNFVGSDSSQYGRRIIEVAKDLNPAHCQAYRLTYGSLP